MDQTPEVDIRTEIKDITGIPVVSRTDQQFTRLNELEKELKRRHPESSGWCFPFRC